MQEQESAHQQRRTEQIAQRRQIRNGRVVRIDLPLPHSMDDDVRDVQQRTDLQQADAHVGEHKEWTDGADVQMHEVGDEDEYDLAGNGHQDEDARGFGIWHCKEIGEMTLISCGLFKNALIQLFRGVFCWADLTETYLNNCNNKAKYKYIEKDFALYTQMCSDSVAGFHTKPVSEVMLHRPSNTLNDSIIVIDDDDADDDEDAPIISRFGRPFSKKSPPARRKRKSNKTRRLPSGTLSKRRASAVRASTKFAALVAADLEHRDEDDREDRAVAHRVLLRARRNRLLRQNANTLEVSGVGLYQIAKRLVYLMILS